MHIKNPVEWLFAQLEATAEATAEAGGLPADEYFGRLPTGQPPAIQKIGLADVRAALRQGLEDFFAARTDVIFLCLIYPVIGLFLAAASARGSALPLLFPLASGFALLGPLFAVGLYEMSRRREITGQTKWSDAFAVLASPSLWPIIVMGLILVGLFLAWLAAAQLIYNLTLGPAPPASIAAFLAAMFTTQAGWAMILLGMAAGGLFAVVALAISVVSFPLLLDSHFSLATAIGTSLRALRTDPAALLGWGAIVTAGLLLGSIPCFLGLVVVLPVLGHASWHLYRRLIRPYTAART
jgi:uncharacterized membrane protein